MSLYHNSPTLSYISANGISVVYDKKMYTVQDFNTNKQFIYWNFETPTVFRASDIRPDTFPGQYLVLVNENGTAIEVPNEDIQVYYDGNSIKSINDRIFGLYETDKEHGNKFVAIEQNISGISQTVGQHTEDIKISKEEISKVNQKADGIDLSVKEVTKEFKNTEVRDELNGCIIKVNSNLGIFKGEFLEYAKDDSITVDEKNAIEVQISIMVESKAKLDTIIDKVIQIAIDKEMNTEKVKLESSKSALTTAHNHLMTSVRNVISDNIITPTDRTLIIDAFAKYNLRVNELKNACDSIVILGMGGFITEELSQISMKSDEINIEVSKKVNGDSIISAINLSPETIKIKSNKIEIEGYVTFSNLKDGTTTISGSNIKTGTIQGIRVEAMSGGAGCVMDGGGIQFYDWDNWWSGTQCGAISYDSYGSGGASDARNRMWIRTINGYAMKIQSDGDMSLEAGSGGQGTGTVWIKKANITSVALGNTTVSSDVWNVDVYGNARFEGNMKVYADKIYNDGIAGVTSALTVATTGNCSVGKDMYANSFLSRYSTYNTFSINNINTRSIVNTWDMLDKLSTEKTSDSIKIKVNESDSNMRTLSDSSNPFLKYDDEMGVGLDLESVIGTLIDAVKELKDNTVI